MKTNKALTLTALATLFLAACGGVSESSSVTSSSSSSSSSTGSSSSGTTETWGIVNGDFEDTTDDLAFNTPGWNQFVSDGAADEIVAAAEYQTEGDNTYGAMVFESTGEPTMWWHAQLRQNGVFLYQNGSYILTFRVRAVEARTIRVQIQGGGLTSKPTALSELPVAVTTQWTTKTINFIAPSAATNAELQFGLGPDSFLPNDLTEFARSSAEIHLDDVKIELGEPLPNQAPTISGGDVLATKGTAVLVKSGLTVRDDYDSGLALSDVQAVDITNGPKLNAANPDPGIYTFVYSLADSEGLVGSHTRKIYVTDPQQLMTNTEFKLNGDKGLPTGWDKFSEDNRGGQNISYGVRPVVLPESMLGNLLNGDFSDGTENFELKRAWSVIQGATDPDGIVGTYGITAGEFNYDITAITNDTQFWHAQLRQENIRLPQGNFSLEFRAKAEEARTIRVALAGGGIVATGRAINETPVVLTTGWETYSIDFTATAHSYGSLLQFFFGPDSFLPDGTGGSEDLATPYGRKFGKVWIDDVTFRYEDAQSPVATMIPALSVELWRIGADGMPWENQLKYYLPFVTGDYKLNFSAHALATRKVMLVAEGSGGLTPDQPRIGAVPTFTPTPQRFSYDMSFAANATNTSHFFAFFMGSYENYNDFKGWWPNIADTTLSAADNVLTTIYLYDFSIDRV